MEESRQSDTPTFSLLGGPLHRLGCRLGLVRGGTNTFALGLALGVFLWAVLVGLAIAGGIGEHLLSLSVISGHARLLLVIPLFFLCESVLDPRCAEFVRSAVRTEIVPRDSLNTLKAAIASTSHCANSWLPEACCVVVAILLSLIAPRLHLFGVTSTHDASRVVGAYTLAGYWYWAVCLTFFRFLMLRWLWRLGLWWYFLWCISRLPLHLVPTHPDHRAGLGYLEVVHTHFTPLILAISVLQCASFAEEITVGKMVFEAMYPALALTLLVDTLLFLGPLFFFSPKLWACRVRGMSEYMDFAFTYVDRFDRKWLRVDAQGSELLGTGDLQSMADLGTSVRVVEDMNCIPFGRRLLLYIAVASLLPVLPLTLFKYPAYEVAQKLLERLFSL